MEEDLTQTKECDYPELISQCKNCAYYHNKKCDHTRNELDKENDCKIGCFEPMDIKKKLLLVYKHFESVLDYYMDLPKEVKNIINLWIIGTYFHEKFNTYPYLFINAMRGSGKTRLLKIITSLAKDGRLLNSLTDAVLFRTKGTLAIDEFEGVNTKEKTSLRELLNSGYKKGAKILRMKKVKSPEGELQVPEEFEAYRPVVMANIWGMEEVLGDRCISVVIEKSFDLSKILLVENFSDFIVDKSINEILQEVLQCMLCSVCTLRNVYIHWNAFVKEITTPHTHTTQHTKHTQTTHYIINELGESFAKPFTPIFEKIKETGIDGRNLELFMPLFLIANEISDEILNETMDYAKKVTNKRKIDELIESKDVLVYSLIAKQDVNQWYFVKDLTQIFKMMLGEELEWVNATWMGKALSRLNLIVERRRHSQGMQVMLNTKKAGEREKMFKPKDTIE